MAIKLAQYICEVAFPVGTVYMTRSDRTAEQVKTLKAGVGTWTQIQNRFLIGTGTVNGQTLGIGATGGANKYTTNPPHTHSVSSSGAHGNHKVNYTHATGGSGGYDCAVFNGGSGWQYNIGSAGSSHSHAVGAKGSAAEDYNNLPWSYAILTFYRSA